MAAKHETAYPVRPRTDLFAGLVVLGFGGVVVVGAWQMDRLTSLGATTYTAPGLWPGIIGLLLALLGMILAWRSLQRAGHAGWDAGHASDAELEPTSRFATAAGLFFAYAVLLVGHGMPYWLATMLFVTTYVFVFRRAVAGDAGGIVRQVLVAGLTGGLTALVVVLVFERLFYVRLP